MPAFGRDSRPCALRGRTGGTKRNCGRRDFASWKVVTVDSAPDHDFQRTVAASLLAFDERITRLTHAVLGIEYLLQVIFTMTHEGFASDFGKNVEARAFVGSDVPDEVLDRLEGFWRGIKDARARRIELEAGGEEQVTVEGRLLKVEQATAVLSDLMRIVYAAHAPSRSLLNEASKSLDQHGHPEPVRQAHERFRDEVGEVAAELAKRRRARRGTGKAQAAATGGD